MTGKMTGKNRKRCARRLAAGSIGLLVVLGLAVLSVPYAAADQTDQYGYTYGPSGIVSSVPGFVLSRTVDTAGAPLQSVDDLATGGGQLYISDALAAAVYVYDGQTYAYKATIAASDETPFVAPKGLYHSEFFNELYIADPEAGAIFVLDAATYAHKRTITRPENMAGDTKFAPYRVAVDSIGRFYIVVQGSYEGILELNPDGGFSRYVGVNKPKVDLIEYFWRSLASDEQKKQMTKAYAPSFNGVDVDSEGFIFAVTGDSSSEQKIFRFNAKGSNVIRAEGYNALEGDSAKYFEHSETTSVFCDVAATDFGTYAVLDRQNGRVFVYDFDGYLLTVFAGKGHVKGQLAEASALAWNGYTLLVGDKQRGAVYVYTTTNFGQAALQAVENYNRGQWSAATDCYRQALEYNANYYAGYSGIGRNYLMERDFEQAVYYYKLAQDDAGYSQAYHGYRGIWIQKYFGWIAVAVLLAATAFILTEVRYARRKGEGA